MRLKCCLARNVIAGMCSGETVPGWIKRHIERCEGCRAEAEAIQAVRAMLQEQAHEQGCPVEWADVRAGLCELEHVRRPVWRLAGAAVCAAVVVATAAFWILTAPAPKQQPAPRQPRMAQFSKPPPERRPVTPRKKPAPQVEKSKGQKASHRAVQAKPVKRRAPRHRNRALPPHRLMVRDDTPSQPPKPAPEAPRIVAVAPEEHVIDIVGVSVDLDEEHSYVIREISAVANGEARGVRL